VLEALAIGQEWEADTRIVLFVRLAEGQRLDVELESRIRAQIRENATPRHVPARILAVPDIPRTKNGKIVELAVASAVRGEPVRNVDSLANPEALQWYRNCRELQY
jgi:acetoacetyl-CoA synthetase